MSHKYRVLISGHVQGVFFRDKTQQHANRMRLKGTVRNLMSGDVEICLSGTKKEVDRLIKALQGEPPPIQVTSVKITTSSSDQIYPDFKIIY